MNNFFLVGSSCFLLIPIVYFLVQHRYQNVMEFILAVLLLLNLIFSIAFWCDAINGGTIHIIDAVFGRISVVLFSIYILALKPATMSLKLTFVNLFISALILFYFSSYYSSIDWISNNHVICHFVFHVFIGAGCLLAFVE